MKHRFATRATARRRGARELARRQLTHRQLGHGLFDWRAAWVLVLFMCLGCGSTQIDATYGKRRGVSGARSVNGTGVLADMFQQAGFKASTWHRLSPRLNDEFDVIVWAPDDFEPPTKEQRAFLEDWLTQKPQRTLVYIGRDFDAEPYYWKRVRPQAPAEQALEISRRIAQSTARHSAARSKGLNQAYARWFMVEQSDATHRVSTLQGPWAKGIVAAETDIEIRNRLIHSRKKNIPPGELDDLPPVQEVLLATKSGGESIPVVLRVSDGKNQGQVIVVANGSFLLNLPLVNHEHRKLAGRLIQQCGPPSDVAFLESGPGGPRVYEEEPNSRYPTGLEPLQKAPMREILMHLLALGIVFCFSIFPIFGRPREKIAENVRRVAMGLFNVMLYVHSNKRGSIGEFGNHIDALGELMERSGDAQYARQRINHYWQHARRESGSAHAEKKPDSTAPVPAAVASDQTQAESIPAVLEPSEPSPSQPPSAPPPPSGSGPTTS